MLLSDLTSLHVWPDPIYDPTRVSAPQRTDLPQIASSATNNEQLQLPGTSETFAWSATVTRNTGRVTIAIADPVGAYVIFGPVHQAAFADSALCVRTTARPSRFCHDR